jgi:hypothetical protein
LTAAEAAVKVAASLGVRSTDPVLAPLGDIPAFLARPQTILTPAQAAALAAAYARLTAELGPYPAQPLHGDAGAGKRSGDER